MRNEKLQEFISGGENLTVEFKRSKNKLNKDVFETVCAFLNRNGGHLLLGVDDDGIVVGTDADSINRIKKDFVTAMNNPQKISPTFYLSVKEVEIEGKTVLYIFVPESSQVHRCNGKIFDRTKTEILILLIILILLPRYI
ncbi:MAG: helix-turn-helix domain-containing protein [Alkaliphilus sp.]